MDDAFDARIAALATSQHGVFRRADVAEFDGTRWQLEHRLRVGRWVELHPLVYAVAGAPETWEQRVLAAVLAMPAGSLASHLTAGALHQVPGFKRGPVQVTATKRLRTRRPVAGVLVHHSTLLPDHHRKTVDAIPTTTVARTLFDLCAVVHPKRAERAVDNCLARKWVTLPALWRVLDDLAIQGRNGTCALREILMERGDDYVAPASELERRFVDLVRRSALPPPAREVNLGDTDQWNGRVEFVYRDEGVLIEIDSRVHHSELLDFENDRDRDNRFAAQGLRVLRFTYRMLKDDPFEVERVLRRALKTRFSVRLRRL
jgi:hypothetical protein